MTWTEAKTKANWALGIAIISFLMASIAFTNSLKSKHKIYLEALDQALDENLGILRNKVNEEMHERYGMLSCKIESFQENQSILLNAVMDTWKRN